MAKERHSWLHLITRFIEMIVVVSALLFEQKKKQTLLSFCIFTKYISLIKNDCKSVYYNRY